MTVAYALLYLWVFAFMGRPTPIATEHGAPEPIPQMARLLDVLSYGFVALFPFGPFDTMPDWVRNYRPGLGLSLLVLVFFVVYSARHGLRARAAAAHASTVSRPAIVALTLLFLSAIYAVMAISGRLYLQFWHMRYNATSVAFSAIVSGLAISMLVVRLRTAVRWVAVAAADDKCLVDCHQCAGR